MDWPGLVRRYVWSAEKTPYLTAAARVSPAQARNELGLYAWFLAMVTAFVAIAALAGAHRHGRWIAWALALYALSVVASAIVLGLTARRWAAVYSMGAPLVVAVATAAGVLGPGLATVDRAIILLVCGAWLAYGVRVTRVARVVTSEGASAAPADASPPG